MTDGRTSLVVLWNHLYHMSRPFPVGFQWASSGSGFWFVGQIRKMPTAPYCYVSIEIYLFYAALKSALLVIRVYDVEKQSRGCQLLSSMPAL